MYLFPLVIIYPFSGFFTALIYTRPAIGHSRRNDLEHMSWLSAFVVVLRAGGEVPQTSFEEDKNKVVGKISRSQPFGVSNEDSMMSSNFDYKGSNNCSSKKQSGDQQFYCVQREAPNSNNNHLEGGGEGLEGGAIVEALVPREAFVCAKKSQLCPNSKEFEF